MSASWWCLCDKCEGVLGLGGEIRMKYVCGRWCVYMCVATVYSWLAAVEGCLGQIRRVCGVVY